MSTISMVTFNKTPLSITVSLLLMGISSAGVAKVAPQTPSVTLAPLVMTSTRIPTKTSNVIAQTTVIEGDQLKSHHGKTVFEVLSDQADIHIKQDGGLGSVSNFYLRGYDSTQILVLIDGIRYSSLSTGQSALNLLPIEQVKRIEILKGASGSSIYGADAMGGVIQIFTKSDFDNNGVSATIGLGSNEHYLLNTAVNLSNDNSHLSASVSKTKSKGIDATSASHPWGIHNGDHDGFDTDNASLALQHKLKDNINVGLSALYSQSKVDFDSDDNFQNIVRKDTHADNRNGSAQAYAEYKYADNASIKLQYGHSIDHSENLNAGYTSVYKTNQDQINLVGKQPLSIGQVVYGAEYLNQSIDTLAYTPKPEDRKVVSAFAGYQLSKDKFDVQANIRHDKNSQYGNETTYNLGGAYRLMDNTRIGASYATGFKAPSFNDLYAWGGNVNLKAETSNNAEVFAEYDLDNAKNRLTVYQNHIDNMIVSDANYQRSNLAKTKIEGVSLNSDWNVNNYLFGVGYDYQKVTDDKADSLNYGKSLYYRPEHKGKVYTGYRGDGFDIRAEYQYTDDFYSDNANNNQLDGYGLLNFSGNYYLNDHVTLNGRINNLTNKKYITTPNYNTDGTNVLVSLTYDY